MAYLISGEPHIKPGRGLKSRGREKKKIIKFPNSSLEKEKNENWIDSIKD